MLVLPKDGEFTFSYFEDDGVSEITESSHNIWEFSVAYNEKTKKGSVRINLQHCGNKETLKNRKITIAFPEGFSEDITHNAKELDGLQVSFRGAYVR